MSGGWKQAKLAGRRPLDGRVRPHGYLGATGTGIKIGMMVFRVASPPKPSSFVPSAIAKATGLSFRAGNRA